MRLARTILAGLITAAMAGCGPTPHDSQEGPAMPPADAPAGALALANSAAFSGDLWLNGSQPFWSARITAEAITLSRPGEEDVTAPNPGPKVSGDVAVWDAPPLKVSIVQVPCSDGMSDRSYALTAQVTLAGSTMKGCAAGDQGKP